MRFKKIEFPNYRCFIDGSLEFVETDGRNINLIIGLNGGGKTEMLFAFWWTLYDFDFSRLQGKEQTPYPLNSDLYKKLEQGNVGDEYSCYVVLEFEHSDKTYRMKKTVSYRKTEKQIRQETFQEFSYYNQNGELSLPVRDSKEIERRLNKIIPKAILNGIIFDGERMQKLSSADEKSKKAIQGVINDITNVELIENCIVIYKDIRKDLNASIKKIAAHTKQYNLEEIVKKIGNDDSIIDDNTVLIEQKKERLEFVKSRLSTISEELKNLNETRLLEVQREQEREKIKGNEKLLDEYYKNFSASLKEAYLLNANNLLNKVDEIIQKIDVPVGLTVEAVKSIMSRDKCICGRCIEAKEIDLLNDLILTLPPDNINSTLAEVIRQTKDKTKDVKDRCKENYKYIVACENSIKESKDQIVSLSSQILSFDEKKAKELEQENNDLSREEVKLDYDIEKLSDELNAAISEREDLISQRDNMGKNNEEIHRLNVKLAFVEKCLSAFDSIKNRNKERALKIINTKLVEAYDKLSEDAALGNTIYIVQYNEASRYQMVVYIKRKAVELIDIWKNNGKYAELENKGLSDGEIEEKAILICADSNSTGQSKMNTLSFAKAILDYSNEQKAEDGLEIQKDYPFLIDAPFSDIAGDNLKNASMELHDFSGQVVLMLDPEKYKSVKNHIIPYVSKIYKLVKTHEQNVTSIEKEV